jgi:hypothetical protein
MFRAKIKLVYKQEIDDTSTGDFERAIFFASYDEFIQQSSPYNGGGRIRSFSRMCDLDERANSLQQKIGFSILYLVSQLNNKIPLIKDNLGVSLDFETPKFELIASHTEDISQHRVAVYYETAALTLIEFMGEYLLLANSGKAENMLSSTFVDSPLPRDCPSANGMDSEPAVITQIRIFITTIKNGACAAMYRRLADWVMIAL